MTILAIIKGRGQEAIDACKSHGIDGKAIRTDIFGSTHIEIADRFSSQISAWYMERDVDIKNEHPIGTLLFFTKYKTGE